MKANSHRLHLAKATATHGYETTADYLIYCAKNSVMDALCDQGCRVEPDGVCSHDCPSPLVAARVI
jgi:hypothetical protein